MITLLVSSKSSSCDSQSQSSLITIKLKHAVNETVLIISNRIINARCNEKKSNKGNSKITELRAERGRFGALIQPTISLEMPVPGQGHYGFHSFPVVD
jgi:hypothetical protein